MMSQKKVTKRSSFFVTTKGDFMKRSHYITAFALYMTYFVHGIGVSILSQ